MSIQELRQMIIPRSMKFVHRVIVDCPAQNGAYGIDAAYLVWRIRTPNMQTARPPIACRALNSSVSEQTFTVMPEWH